MKTRVWKVLAVLAVLIASLAVWALPTKTYAVEGDVAKIERTGVGYDTFDDAFAAAQDGDTITLLADAEVTESLDKSVVIDGQNRYTLTSTNHRYGFTWGKDRCLTFKNITANFYYLTEIENPTYSSDLGLFYINGKGNAPTFYDDTFDFTFDNATINMVNGDDTGNEGATNRLHAIYYDSCGGTITMKNGSTVTISNFPEDAIEWGGQANSYLNIEGSTYISEANRGGIIGTWNVTINDSTVSVLDSDTNGSNGAHFDIDDSTVTFSGNKAHGLSTGDLFISNSEVTAENNQYIGIAVGRDLTIDGESTVNVSGNAYGNAAGYAGMRLYGNSTDGHDYQYSIDETSTVNITNNKNTGLYVRYGTLSVADGAKLTITGNTVTNTTLDGYGGGLYVGYGANYDPVVTLPDNAVIYNNHSLNGGDDIYVSEGVEGPELTFGPTGSDWALDGDPDCTDTIDGWYVDAEDARWEAHADSYDGIHVEEYTFDDDTTTATGPLALKAAHGLGVVVVDPADITIYMGGTDGYEGVSSDGQIAGSNSLPEPGFYLTLPDDVNAALQTAGAATEGEKANLSQYLTIYTHGYAGGNGELHWTLEPYGETYSGANGRHIYRIVPAPTEDQEAVPVRLEFIDGEGNTSTSDTFVPSESGALNEHYTMQLYTELVDKNQVVFEVKVAGRKFYNTMELETGDLNVRYVTGEQAEVVTDVLASIEDAIAPGERAYAVAPEGTRFTINESNIDVTDTAAPSLLFDDVVTDDNTDGAAAYDEQLAARAQTVAEQAGADLGETAYEAKYLDLVDANNGNAWIMASEPVTVYWPYPAGTDENTEFHLVHFEGLDRELSNGEILGAIDSANAVYVEVENTEHGVRFTTNGFSPFVLMWDASGTTTPSEPVKPSDNLAATGDSTMLAVVAAAAGGTLCLGASRVVKKHRDK